MSAPIVIGSDDLRVIMSNADFRTLAGGRVRKYRGQGQLWEREAERTPNVLAPQYSARLMDASLNARIRAGQRERTQGAGVPWPSRVAMCKGIIRAGVRIR
jgi:hypothetical protein